MMKKIESNESYEEDEINNVSCTSEMEEPYIEHTLPKESQTHSSLEESKVEFAATYSEKNLFRRFFKGDAKKRMTILKGLYYQGLHALIMFFAVLMICFVNDVWMLVAAIVVITLDGISNVILHNCPLTIMEEKYLHTNLGVDHKNILKNCGIQYDCDHLYESQLEVIIHAWSLIAIKILCLILYNYYISRI